MILEAPKRKTGRKGGSTKILAGTKSNGVNVLQEKFIEHYTDLSNINTFGNGLRSYALAYNYELKDSAEKRTCSSEASRLLTNPFISEAIRDRLSNLTLNDQLVDSRLAFVLESSFDDKKTLLSAIDQYNRLKGRHKSNNGNTINVLSIQGLESNIKELLGANQQNL